MSAEEYWFARRFPLGSPRAGMSPIHWKGYAVVAGYLFVLLLGAGAFAWFAIHERNMAEGLAFFVGAASLSSIVYISVARHKGDRIRTVADYKKDRAGA